MSLTVCLAPANTVAYPNGGGHLWVYLHWALALRDLGCRVIWLEGIDVDDRDTSPAGRRRRRGGAAPDCVATLKARLAPYGLADALALYAISGDAIPRRWPKAAGTSMQPPGLISSSICGTQHPPGSSDGSAVRRSLI